MPCVIAKRNSRQLIFLTKKRPVKTQGAGNYYEKFILRLCTHQK